MGASYPPASIDHRNANGIMWPTPWPLHSVSRSRSRRNASAHTMRQTPRINHGQIEFARSRVHRSLSPSAARASRLLSSQLSLSSSLSILCFPRDVSVIHRMQCQTRSKSHDFDLLAGGKRTLTHRAPGKQNQRQKSTLEYDR